MTKYLLPLFFIVIGTSAQSQINGGQHVYDFLNLSSSARITALGGHLLAVRDDDVALAFSNPSSLNSEMGGALTFQHSFLFDDIAHGNASYGHYFKNWDITGHAGFQYVRYGNFDATDEVGNVIGTFDASETAFVIGAGKQLYERLSVGTNLKVVSSQFETYNSWGILGDISATFHDTSSLLNITLVARNMGTQLSTYTPDNREPLPFEMQIGISKRLRYLPFRFSITYQHLQRWNLLYDDPNTRDEGLFFSEDNAEGGSDFFDNLFRHFVFGGEFLFGKRENFRLRLGYNHLRNRELSVSNIRSLTGFSFGAGIKISKFRIDYGQQFHHIGGRINHLGISTNFKSFGKKKRVVR